MKNLKLKKLKNILKKLKSVVIAYSGGVDSTFLVKMAIDTLGHTRVIAVTARSETYPYSEYKDAKRLAKRMGAKHITIHTKELRIKNFKSNPLNRCYYCKFELFKKLIEIKRRASFAGVVDGTNYDDLKDIRYGRKAAEELGVRSPLLEAGIGKDLIRRHSKELELDTWQKPSFACLASRLPFHTDITAEKLEKIDKAENYLRQLGFKQVRVRIHKEIARLEFYKEDFKKMLSKEINNKVIKHLKVLGFKYITMDLEGYRTGSMHETYNVIARSPAAEGGGRRSNPKNEIASALRASQ